MSTFKCFNCCDEQEVTGEILLIRGKLVFLCTDCITAACECWLSTIKSEMSNALKCFSCCCDEMTTGTVLRIRGALVFLCTDCITAACECWLSPSKCVAEALNSVTYLQTTNANAIQTLQTQQAQLRLEVDELKECGAEALNSVA